MTTIAIYSAKGGVGKTTLAVGLAWAAAVRSSRRTLLWDLDAQAAASFVLARAAPKASARDVIERDASPADAIVATAVEGLSILPADGSIRGLDSVFASIDRKNRLTRVLRDLDGPYDRILLDCPPGLGDTADQVIRAADLIVVPLIPSPLSRHAYDAMTRHLASTHKTSGRILPVFSMADRRRAAHRDALAAAPDWPVIPMASIAEHMATHRAPIGDYAPKAPVAQAIAALWTTIERTIA